MSCNPSKRLTIMVALAAAVCVSPGRCRGATGPDFEDLGLAAESFWNGSDSSGGFTSGGLSFNNSYDTQWGSWGGWAYSSITDNVTAGWENQYSAITGSGYGGSDTYGVAYYSGWPAVTVPTITIPDGSDVPDALFVTNTTFAYFSMREGDDFVFAFEDGDWQELIITGKAGDTEVSSVAVDLAIGTDILDDWAELDLSGLQGCGIDSLEFSFAGSQADMVPSYVAVDAPESLMPGDALTSIADGNWNDAATWDGDTLIPTVQNATTVENNHTVVVAEDGNTLSLNIDGTSATVAIDPARTLNVVNNVQLTAGKPDIASTGKLDVGGSFATEQGTSLSVAMGRSTEPVIVVADSVTLDEGTLLAVTAVDSLGDLGAQEWGEKTRTIVTAEGGVTGEFDPLSLNAILGHGVFYGSTTYDANAIHLNLFQAGPGDINGDREVDFTDIWELLTSGYYNVSNPDIPAVWTDGDTTGDGMVDFSDVWDALTGGLYDTGPYDAKTSDGIDAVGYPALSNTMSDVGQAATVVPEPGIVGLMAGGLLLLLLWRALRVSKLR